MRRKALLALPLALLLSCEPTLRESPQVGLPEGGIAGSQLTTPPSPCSGCVLAPTTFTRKDGQKAPEIREFPGDPAADYLLIVQDDGQVGTGAEIKLNGETIVAAGALKGTEVAELKRAVTLSATNRLTVLPVGKAGAKVVVWVLGGTAVMDDKGGTVTAPFSGASITFPAASMAGQLLVQLTDVPLQPARYAPWSSTSHQLTITDLAGGATFSPQDSIVLRLPTRSMVQAGFKAAVHVTIPGFPADYWGIAESTSGPEVLLGLPVDGLDDLHTVFAGAPLTITVSVELLEDTPVLVSAARSRLPAARLATPSYCPASYLTITFSGGVPLDCSRFPELALASTSPARNGSTAVVLVHGWSPDIAQPMDLYTAQGFDCSPRLSGPGAAAYISGYDCAKNATAPTLPGEMYFSTLLGELRSAFPTTPFYTYTYASSDHFTFNGAALADKIHQELSTPGVSDFVIVAHSMGGLVAREAVEYLRIRYNEDDRVRGIIALGTPHTGTPLPGIDPNSVVPLAGNLLLKKFAPGVLTVGGGSLVNGLGTRTEETTIFAYAGVNDFPRIIPSSIATWPFPSTMGPVYKGLGTLMCGKGNECTSDGVVPVGSATGQGVFQHATLRRFNDYDHSQLHAGRFLISGDLVHVAIISDLQSLLPPGGGGPPDLLPLNVTGPTAAQAGQTAVVHVDQQNAGTGAVVGGWLGEIRLSQDQSCVSSAGDPAVLVYNGPALAAGASAATTHSGTIPANMQPGRWYWCVILDPAGGTVPESNEFNNTLMGNAIDITSGGPGTLRYSDDFASGLGNWVEHDVNGLGSWTTQNNELIGDYNIGCGSPTCHQTQLILADALQPANNGYSNWRMEIQSGQVQAYCCFNGGAIVNLGKFALLVSDTEKEALDIGNAWNNGVQPPASMTVAYAAHQAYPWFQVAFQSVTVPTWNPNQWQTAILEKVGNQYSVYFKGNNDTSTNGTLIYTTTRTFSGPVKLGFSTYGKVRLDNFKLYELP